MYPAPKPIHPIVEGDCPAKINLRLAVLGKRSDGYHNLSSVVAPISLSDHLQITWHADDQDDHLTIPKSDLETDETNLVMRAVKAYRSACPFPGHVRIRLTKSIPCGAGLGGGSSDAAGTLRLLQTMWGQQLDHAALQSLAIGLGADVPFFLQPETALMEGIGDVLTPLPELHTQLKKAAFLVFKPAFGISTIWAYGALAAVAAYQSRRAEARFLVELATQTHPLEALPFNAFRSVVDARYPTIPVLLDKIGKTFARRAEMSGSGSACFVAIDDAEMASGITHLIQSAWGPNAFVKPVRVV